MQLTLRIRIPSGVSKRDQKLVKRIETFVTREINSKFGKQVELTKRNKTKSTPRKLTAYQIHKQLIRQYNSSKINSLQYFLQVLDMKLFVEAGISRTECKRRVKLEQRDVRSNRRT